jgi:MFS family permease
LTFPNHFDKTGWVKRERPLLRNRNFLWLWGGDAISQLGSQFTLLAIPVLAVAVLGATELEVGFLAAAQTAAFLLVGLPAGAWVDRMLKRRVMITADLVRAVALALVPILALAQVLQIWHLYVVAAVVGIATVFFDVSYQSYPPILLPGNQIGSANSKLEATAQVARIGGPGIAGAMLSVVTVPVLLIVDAVSYLVSAVAIWRIRDDEQRPDPASRQSLPKEIAEGLRFVFGHRLLRRIVGTTGGSNLFGAIANTLLPVLVLRTLGLDPIALGIVFGVGSAGGLLGALATPWVTKRIGEGTAISVSAIVFGVALFAMPLSAIVPREAALPVLVGGEFLVAFSVLIYNITQVTMRQRICPPRLLGRMNASIRFVVWGVLPIGSLLAGFLGTVIGLVPTMLIGAIGGLLAGGFVVFSPITTIKVLPKELEGSSEAEIANAALLDRADDEAALPGGGPERD